MSETKVSVVIPTYNCARDLAACLISIRSNKTKYWHEIITVDAGSQDNTLEVAHKYADKVLVQATNPPRINRNKGVDCAQGSVICFTDSDCVVPQDWIDQLVDGLTRLQDKDDKVVGVGGGNVPLVENPLLMELAIARAMRSPLVSFKARNTAVFDKERQVPHNPPLNAAYFKWALQAAGGFREEHGYGGEDMALDATLVRQGF
ncbi:MAG: hypothetical protein A2Y91_04940, partial [Chloroflexi bacterium RBG_13_54_8]